MFITLNPILATVALVSSSPKPTLRVNQSLSQNICGFVNIHHYPSLFIVANSADPGETPFGAICTIAYFEFQANYAPVSCVCVRGGRACVRVCR